MLKPETWVEKYGDSLYNYAYVRVNHAETARNLVQEVFLLALQARDSFKGKSSEQTILTTILRNKIIDYYRTKEKATQTLLHDSLPFKDRGMLSGHWRKSGAPDNWKKNAEKLIENEELAEALQKCLGHLPYQWRSSFFLKKIDEESTENVCKELEIPASNVWIILHRARLKLRECLEKSRFKNDRQ